MLARLRSRLTYANLAASLALFVALGSGSAVAANLITGVQIKNGSIGAVDIARASLTAAQVKDGTLTDRDLAPGARAGRLGPVGPAGARGARGLTGAKGATGPAGSAATLGPAAGDLLGTYPNLTIKTGGIMSASVLNDTVPGGGLGSEDIRPLHGDADIIDNSITTEDLGVDSVDADEVRDFGLTNEDIGVLKANVSVGGVLTASSGGVTVTKLVGAGSYEVDFGRDVSQCAYVATIGIAGTGPVDTGEVTTARRTGNLEAVYVATYTSAGVAADRPFVVITVC